MIVERNLVEILMQKSPISHSIQGVLDTTLCDKVCQWPVTDQWFSLGTLVSSTNKTDCHDIIEILLKVALNTIILTLYVVLVYFVFILLLLLCLHCQLTWYKKIFNLHILHTWDLILIRIGSRKIHVQLYHLFLTFL
jgi:hypothetical protein